jgi:hypothetical protein
MSRGWVFAPQSGGRKVPPSAQERIRRRIVAYAQTNHRGKFDRIDIHFRGQFCYVDAYVEPFVPEHFNETLYGESREEHVERLRTTPIHLCRLRYFGSEDSLSMAFFSYGPEKYEPCLFHSGSWTGTPEEAFETCTPYLGG